MNMHLNSQVHVRFEEDTGCRRKLSRSEVRDSQAHVIAGTLCARNAFRDRQDRLSTVPYRILSTSTFLCLSRPDVFLTRDLVLS